MVDFVKLSKYALLGCAGCFGMAIAFHRLFTKTISENPLYTEALNSVKQHRGALYLLGEPIESKKPVLANKGMMLAGYSDVQVQVSGPKSTGIVFLKVIKGEDEKVKVDSIQLQVGKDYSRRLLIKDSSKKPEDSNNEVEKK